MTAHGSHIHLPPLTGEQAYLLALILEETVKAIWRAHGDDMASFQGRAFPDEPSPTGSVIKCDHPESDANIDF